MRSSAMARQRQKQTPCAVIAFCTLQLNNINLLSNSHRFHLHCDLVGMECTWSVEAEANTTSADHYNNNNNDDDEDGKVTGIDIGIGNYI